MPFSTIASAGGIEDHLYLTQVVAPTAPTVAINVAAGNLNGAYYYRISYVTAVGETESGVTSALVSPVSQQVNLTAIPVSADPDVTARKIYRTTGGGSQLLMKLVTTINNNTGTTYTDNIADVNLGVSEPRVNTTGAVIFNNSDRSGIADNASTALGVKALRVNVGHNNSALGINALYNNTTGYRNTAIGMSALYTNITHFENTAIGFNTLYFNTANYNTAVGASALYNNSTGYKNTAVGTNALLSNTTGELNSAVGADALCSNVVGGSNTAIGAQALYNNTGAENTAVGVSTLFDNVAGYANTALGFQAGRGGVNELFENNNCVFIGYNARSTVDNLTNAIAIGSEAQATLSNQVVLGNASVVQTLLRGSVGAGITPTSKLHSGGSFALPISTKTSAYTATISDHTILADATTAAFSVTLPTAVGITGRIYIVKKIDAGENAVTVDAAGTQTIDGAETVSLATQWSRVTIQSNGTNWFIVN